MALEESAVWPSVCSLHTGKLCLLQSLLRARHASGSAPVQLPVTKAPSPLCMCTHGQLLQGRQLCRAGRQTTDYLQVGLLAPLHQLVEGWGAQVVVHMGRVEPL